MGIASDSDGHGLRLLLCLDEFAYRIRSCFYSASLFVVSPPHVETLIATSSAAASARSQRQALPAELQPVLPKDGYGTFQFEPWPEHIKKYTSPPRKQSLHEFFGTSEIKPWQPKRFEQVKKLQDAMCNHGYVNLMQDKVEQKLVVVKVMPMSWTQGSHTEFLAKNTKAFEFPWNDIGCMEYLKSVGFRQRCDLLGVYQDEKKLRVVTTYANRGDLFSWCSSPASKKLPLGSEREEFIRPLIMEMLLAVQQVHELSIVHHDISMENMLLSKDEKGSTSLRIIDFGMASFLRFFHESDRGKSSYQAPEIHEAGDHDGFLTDAFALGVTIYAISFLDYPWMSTKPGGCQCFEYVRAYGFRAFTGIRKLRKKKGFVKDYMSEDLLNLLDGLLQVDPAKRLTLGESAWRVEGGESSRMSVWEEPWVTGRNSYRI